MTAPATNVHGALCSVVPCHGEIAVMHRYNRLKKPEWTPPKWVFGPTWAVMYAAQGYAGWRVLHQASSRSKLSLPLIVITYC